MPVQILATLALIAALGTSHNTDIWVLSATPPALLSVVFVSTLQYALSPYLAEQVASGKRVLLGSALIPYLASGAGLALAINLVAGLIGHLAYHGAADATLLSNALRVQALSSAVAIVATGMTLIGSIYRRYGRAAFAIFLNATLSPILAAILARPFGVMGAALGALIGSTVFLAAGTLSSPVRAVSELFVPPEIPPGTLPLAFSTTAMQANGILERFVATGYQAGTVTALALSNRLMAAVVGVMTAGLSISLVPHFAHLYVERGLAAVQQAAGRLQSILIPISQAIVSLATIGLLIGGQSFLPPAAGNSRALAQLCVGYGIYVVASIASLVTASACYVIGYTRALSLFIVSSFGGAVIVRLLLVKAGAPVIVVPVMTSVAFLGAWLAGMALLGQIGHWTRGMSLRIAVSAVSLASLTLLAWRDGGTIENVSLGALSLICVVPLLLALYEQFRPGAPSSTVQKSLA